jgi:Fe-S-cluster-containing dehydrogenase component
MKITRRNALKTVAAAGAAMAIAEPAEARVARVPGAADHAMLFDATLCVGCRACQTACKAANGLPPDERTVNGGVYDAPLDLNGSTKNVIKLARQGEATAYVKAQCMHCADAACVSVCMAGALHYDPKMPGVVVYNDVTCVGCRYCQIGCAFNVPKFQWSKALPFPVADQPRIVKCELCRERPLVNGKWPGPACCEVCPRAAVVYGRRGELLQEAKQRIAASPGKYFEDRVYGETDGGGTHVLYLSPKELSFAALGLPGLPHEPLPEMGEKVQHAAYKWGIAPLALYATLTIVQLRARKKAESESHGHGEGK